MTAGVLDALHALLGLPPYLRPAVGVRGEGTVIADAHAKDTMLTLAGPSSS